ncbi:RHS repeat-associated core domain-containing protein [Pseudomonas inefficax]|uniref:RHS repeat-associated core domain-containing protein n=1 Tax=Pseudomonas inefficax TaxID=2078786 RepID=UPI0028BF10E1|nr:RHS repeat-associated core domain-containing protein [Pseudomonas inefficax]WNN39918.1 RHS repeat-associated core domain-containing protein [Pseudomonas inefficax]
MNLCFRNATFHNQRNHAKTYTPYGFSVSPECLALIGFAGQLQDMFSGCYLLGNGRRTYSSSLCRFVSPDFLSPFGRGGVNAYAYCSGDPVNYIDPSGFNRNGVRGRANPQMELDIAGLEVAGFPPSLHPQLSHFRKVARGIHRGQMENSKVVARLYKQAAPHYAYNRWDLKYNFETGGFAADFVSGDPISHLPAGNYEVKQNVFVLGVGAFRPARGLGNYKSYEVSKADLAGFSLPAAQHDRAQLGESAWPEVAKAMWNVRFGREIDKFDEMLENYGPPAVPTPPPRRR